MSVLPKITLPKITLPRNRLPGQMAGPKVRCRIGANVAGALFLMTGQAFAAALVSGETGAATAPAMDPAGKARLAFVWDLGHLFETPEAWDAARRNVLDGLPDLSALEPEVKESPAALLSALQDISAARKAAQRVSVYATLEADVDLTDAAAQKRDQQADDMMAALEEATSWLAPAVLRIGRQRIEGAIAAEPDFAPFTHQLRDILRRAPHTLAPEAEAALAAGDSLRAAPFRIYNLLSNADMAFPSVPLASGEVVRIDAWGYERHRNTEDRGDRKAVFDAFFGTWAQYEHSLGATLEAHIAAQIATTRARGFGSAQERTLFQENLPPDVLDQVIAEANRALPLFHRYLDLRRRALDLEQQRYYDSYASPARTSQSFSLGETRAMALKVAEPLGPDYVALFEAALDARWMHALPDRSKRSTSYMNGEAYDVHPYILLKHADDYESASLFSHEWGHALHSALTNEAQPFPLADYSSLVGEVPAILHEMLLNDHLVETAQNAEEKMYFLWKGLDLLRGTFFRQAMFAEFERGLYRLAEAGENLTGPRMTEFYGQLLRRYHGHDQGTVIIDDLYTYEWMYVPHFYYSFYVWRYASSTAAAAALLEDLQSDPGAARARYEALLKAGGSDYPLALLKEAGLDLTTPELYDRLFRRMERMIGEIERLMAIREARRAN